MLSLADQVAALPEARRRAWVDSLKPEQVADLVRRPWWFVRRPEQEAPPGLWMIWLILSGRGWGKSRTGSETLAEWALDLPTMDGVPTEWAIIAETIRDAREVCVLGPSGILNALRRRGLAEGVDWTYHSTFGVITLLQDGQKIHVLGADDADVARGLNLAGAWLDEVAKWRYSWEAWIEGILPALRIGPRPRCIVTTTPKPIKLLKDWLARTDGSVHVTRGSTFDNAVNLSKFALSELRRRYHGTRTGRQELYGELLEDVEGALFQRSQIDADRRVQLPVALNRIVVAVDPATSSGEDADETGIVVTGKGDDGRGYVLADRTVKGATPLEWATAVVQAYDDFGANEVVVEVNQGGEMVATVLHQVRPGLPVTEVHAKKSKRVRAEPVSALYQQHLISHVGEFATMEDQITTWTPDEKDSPDRLDALVYSVTALFEDGAAGAYLAGLMAQSAAPCRVCGIPTTAGRCAIHG